jgi:hypothetical protein
MSALFFWPREIFPEEDQCEKAGHSWSCSKFVDSVYNSGLPTLSLQETIRTRTRLISFH